MSTPNLPFSLFTTEPQLKDLMDLMKKDIMLNLNCCHVATIQSFNYPDQQNGNAKYQTVQATVNYKKTFYKLNTASKVYEPYQVDYPLLADCPAIILSGGSSYLNMPIQKGDECLMFFNDRAIDNWFQGSTTAQVPFVRFHSIADGFALVGVRNKTTAIQVYDEVRAILTNGTVKNGINPQNNKLVLTNGTSLSTLLQNLCTQLNSLTTALAAMTITGVTSGTGTSGPPSNASTITNIGTQISSISTQIQGLIE